MHKLYFVLLLCLSSFSVIAGPPEELDRAFIYVNEKLVGAWRADEGQIVHIENIADGDTITVRAKTDLGGLGNSSIDIKDDSGVPIDNIESPTSTDYSATFVYVFHSAKIDRTKALSLQIFLNFDPSRSVQPPIVASILFTKQEK